MFHHVRCCPTPPRTSCLRIDGFARRRMASGSSSCSRSYPRSLPAKIPSASATRPSTPCPARRYHQCGPIVCLLAAIATTTAAAATNWAICHFLPPLPPQSGRSALLRARLGRLVCLLQRHDDPSDGHSDAERRGPVHAHPAGARDRRPHVPAWSKCTRPLICTHARTCATHETLLCRNCQHWRRSSSLRPADADDNADADADHCKVFRPHLDPIRLTLDFGRQQSRVWCPSPLAIAAVVLFPVVEPELSVNPTPQAVNGDVKSAETLLAGGAPIEGGITHTPIKEPWWTSAVLAGQPLSGKQCLCPANRASEPSSISSRTGIPPW